MARATATPEPFVGRESLVAKCVDALDQAQVIVLRGAAGVGKSRLLRETFADRDVVHVAPDTPGAAVTGPARNGELLVLDGFDDPVEQEAFAARILREAPDAQLVLATRSVDTAPNQHLDGPVVTEIDVPALTAEQTEALAARFGTALELARRLHVWAEGLPGVALVAIDALETHPDWLPGTGEDPADVSRRLRRGLVPATLPELHYAALATTALTRRVSIEALAAVVPQADADVLSRWLMSRGLVQSAGSGIEIANRVLRRVVLADLRHSQPWLEHSLRQRLAEHVHSGAMTGRTWLAADLVDLIESPTIRLAWGTGASDVRTRRAEPADALALNEKMRDRGLAKWWESASPFFTRAPERVTVATGENEELLGYCIAVTPRNAPDFAHADPVLGPRLAHAKNTLRSRNAVIFRDSLLFGSGAGDAVRGAMHLASIMRSDAPNPRHLYVAVAADQTQFEPFLAAIAAKELKELRALVGERDMRCFLVDCGPDGMLDASRGQILNELGQGPSPFDHRDTEPEAVDVRAELENVVRNYQRPDLLAASPLAGEGSTSVRVEFVRARVLAAADAAFGESDREVRLREALGRAYFDKAANHDRAALDMHVSRTTYFRLLRTALDRTVDQLVENGAFDERAGS